MHFFLTTRPQSGYCAIIGAGLPSCHLSLIHETHPCDTSHTDAFRDKMLSKKKKIDEKQLWKGDVKEIEEEEGWYPMSVVPG